MATSTISRPVAGARVSGRPGHVLAGDLGAGYDAALLFHSVLRWKP